MLAAIPFPDVSSEVFSISVGDFQFALRWYALAYIAGILLGWLIVRMLAARPALWPVSVSPMTREQVDELLTAIVIGVIVGGRLGYVLFYQPAYYLQNPLEILVLWRGGMSFHGGFLGVVAAGLFFARRHGIPKLQLADALAVATPVGLFFGRLANFVNAELWGRPSSVPWAVIFPGEAAQSCGIDWPQPCARHPSQLYEAGLEGILLGLVLLAVVRAGGLRRPGLATGVFLAGYGLARAFVELFREADAQFISADNPMGHVLRLTDTAGLSMGQLLSLPMVLAGIALIALSRRRA